MITRLKATLLGAALSCATFAGAQAQVIYGDVGPGYGYAGSAIRGDYVGAPLTRFPRPDQIVPSAWGYGTYGVPTVSGIHPAPVGTPTVYVIEPPAPAARATAKAHTTAGPRVLARDRASRFAPAPSATPYASAGGARVVPVSVPARQATLR